MKKIAEEKKDQQMMDSRQVAETLGLKHSSFFRQILKYQKKFEEFGTLYVHNKERERFVLFTEAQAIFLRTNILLFLSADYIY